MKSFKRIISGILVLIIIITSIPVTAFAKNNDSYDIVQDDQNSNNNANKNAAEIHKQKAEEQLAKFRLPELSILQGSYTEDYKKAQQFLKQGLEFENNEQYMEAKDAYQESWKILIDINNKLDEINNIIDEIKSRRRL
jgi:hypothetical protein